jgi:gamma-glutamylcyclotransferase (GGCT)/AIG2-like uncharacterized protein YtfP
MEKKAVFVYGSLREGLYNYQRCLTGRVEKMIPAQLKGYELYSVYGSYPAMVQSQPQDEVTGELMILKEDQYEDTMATLDRLEGYREGDDRHSMYLRQVKEVLLENGQYVEAYVYVWNRSTRGLAKVDGGDWKPYYLSKAE